MNPTTEREPGETWIHGPTVWRGLIILTLILMAVSLYIGSRLFDTNHDAIAKGKEAIAKNRELGCRIGAFLVGIPIVKQPGTSQKTFEHSVVAAEDFLHALEALDCKGLGKVTTEAINKQLKALHKIVPEGGGGPTANAPPSPSGGGPTGPSPSPPTPGPQPGPPPTVPPPTVPPTTTPGPIPNLICHINPLGIRICVNR
jgi:hypothetical protein